EQAAVELLVANKRNTRTHSKKQLHQIAASIREFGFTNPVLIDQHSMILAGHGRVEAAKLLGMKTVPAIRFEHWTEAQKRLFGIADNRIALNAGWDFEMLARDLEELAALKLDLNLEITGFDT